MKKVVFLLFIIIVLAYFITSKSKVLIPNEAIRIRIIANSNSIVDQKMKNDIKNEIDDLLYKELKDVDSYEKANKIIIQDIDDIKRILLKYTDDYEISFGENYFPEKEYKGVNYSAGNYESLVIKLGKAEGNNFWCVLFPPLCMIDENKLNNVSYSLFVSELLNKIK